MFLKSASQPKEVTQSYDKALVLFENVSIIVISIV